MPLPSSLDDEWFMGLALVQADFALATGDVPIGAIVVGPTGEVWGADRNRREGNRDPTGHAEIFALRRAAAHRGDWRLAGATAFVTVEPCPMCAGALVQARVARVVYGCPDTKAGALGSVFSIGLGSELNHRFEVRGGVLGEACARRLQLFFALLRAAGEK